MTEAIELLREYRMMLKAKRNSKHAHVVHNAIQFLLRKQKEANVKRVRHPKAVKPARPDTSHVQAAKMRKRQDAADRAARKQQKLAARLHEEQARQTRNEEIVRRVRNGEKRYVLAKEYGLSPNTISIITVKSGVEPFSRPSRKKNKPSEKGLKGETTAR